MKRRTLLPLLICGLAGIHSAIAEDQSVAPRTENSDTPPSSAAALTQSLRAAGPKAAAVVVPETVAAIQALGPEATSKQISAIVYAAVRATPDSALNIVRAAVKLSPGSAPDIAAAAARAVPNPWKEVRYQKGPHAEQPPQTTTPAQLPPQPPGAKEPDFKSSPKERDFKSPPVDRSFLEPVQEALNPGDPADPGAFMSLAEAIVYTAVEAGGKLDPVQLAVDAALYGDPGLLFNQVGGVRGISAQGNAGNSNYGNEPFKKLTAPKTPDPKAVSR